MQLGSAVNVVNRNDSRDSSLPCRQAAVKIGMVEVAVHQINTLPPDELNQGRRHAPVDPSLFHQAQFHYRNIHGGQLLAHHATHAYTTDERSKALVVQPAHDAEQEILGTANREGDKEMKYSSSAIHCGALRSDRC